MTGEPRPRLLPAVLFAAGLALFTRLAILLLLSGNPFTQVMVGDSLTYLRLAEKIAAGRAAEIGVFFSSAPLYALVLAVAGSFSEAVWAPVAVLQVVVASAACAAVAMMAAAVFPEQREAPWIAGMAAALYAPSIYFDAEVLPASLAASALGFALLLTLTPGGRGRSIATGLVFGVATLLAPATLLVVACAVTWVLVSEGRRPDRPRVTRAVSMVVGTLIVIAPVTIHNTISGDFVLVSSNAGVNAFIGNNAQATGAFFLPPDSGLDGTRLEPSATAVVRRDLGRDPSPSEVSSFWAGRARSFARAQPGTWLRLLGRKALLTINRYEIPNHLNFQFVVSRFAPGLGWLVPFWVVFPLTGLGAVVALRARSRPAWLLLAAVVVTLAVPVLFFATARYRLPAVLPMLVLAGGGAGWLVAKIEQRRWVSVAGATLLLAVLAAPTRLTLVKEGDYAFDHLLLGNAYRQLERLDEAAVEMKLAVETATIDHRAELWLAGVLVERGNTEEAAAVLDRYLERRPGDVGAKAMRERLTPPLARGPERSRTAFEYASTLLARGDLAEAEAVLTVAIERDPVHVPAMIGLAAVRARRDDLDGAFASLQRAARLAPDNAEVWSGLAAVYRAAGNEAAAQHAAKRARELDSATGVR